MPTSNGIANRLRSATPTHFNRASPPCTDSQLDGSADAAEGSSVTIAPASEAMRARVELTRALRS